MSHLIKKAHRALSNLLYTPSYFIVDHHQVTALWIIIYLCKLTLIFFPPFFCPPPLEIDSVTDPPVLWNPKTAIFWREVKKSSAGWLRRAPVPVCLSAQLFTFFLIQQVQEWVAVDEITGGGGFAMGGLSIQFEFYFQQHVLLCVLLQWLRGSDGDAETPAFSFWIALLPFLPHHHGNGPRSLPPICPEWAHLRSGAGACGQPGATNADAIKEPRPQTLILIQK